MTTGDHFYTTSYSEAITANADGYIIEGTSCYVFGSQEPDSIPLYRLFSPTAGDHFSLPLSPKLQMLFPTLATWKKKLPRSDWFQVVLTSLKA